MCGTTIHGEAPLRGLAWAAWYVGHGLLVCLGWTTFFAFCGLIVALATGEWALMGALAAFGLIAGALFGVGDLIVRATRRRQEAADESVCENHADTPVAILLAGLIPVLKPTAFVMQVIHFFVTRDRTRQRPGRRKRALLGAVVLGLIGTGLLAAVRTVMGPPPPGGMTLVEAAVFVLILCGVGAVLGLLSDSW